MKIRKSENGGFLLELTGEEKFHGMDQISGTLIFPDEYRHSSKAQLAMIARFCLEGDGVAGPIEYQTITGVVPVCNKIKKLAINDKMIDNEVKLIIEENHLIIDRLMEGQDIRTLANIHAALGKMAIERIIKKNS